MMKKLLFLMILFLIPVVSGMEFTQDTTINTESINFHFLNGSTGIDDFQIISNGIILNENHRLVFVVEGGELDVYFYEWSEENNVIGLVSNVPQDVIFKITVDNKKKALLKDNNYYIDSIYVGLNEMNVSYVEYGTEDNVVIRTIEKDKWYETKFVEFEYDTRTLANGKIEGKTFGVTYLGLILSIIVLIIIIWLVRRQ